MAYNSKDEVVNWQTDFYIILYIPLSVVILLLARKVEVQKKLIDELEIQKNCLLRSPVFDDSQLG
jgi:hypothetical protein